MFTQLHIHTDLGSLLDAIASSEDYAKKAHSLGHTSLAITDHGRMTGVYAHQQACDKYGIKPIFGVESYLVDNLVSLNEKDKRVRDKTNHLILLAKNETGYKNLLRLNYISMNDDEHFYYTNRITQQELFQYGDGLMVGTACLGSKWGRLLRDGKEDDAVKLYLEFLDRFKDDFYTEVQLNELTYEMDHLKEGQKSVNDFLIDLANKHGVPIVLTGDVHYAEKGQDELQTISIAIRNKDTIDNLTFEIESKHLYYHKKNDYFTFNKDFGYNYSEDKISEWTSNTQVVADKCNYRIPERRRMFIPSLTDNDEEVLVEASRKALQEKFDNNPPKEYEERLSHELEILIRKGFSSYVLILKDIVDFVLKEGFMVAPGRGSAAGSLVLYLLGITSIDPIEHGLLFERFLSDQRSPDLVPQYFSEDIEKGKMETTLTELKDRCEKELENYPEYKKDFVKEFLFAKNFYKNGIDLIKAFSEKEIVGNYIIPFFLGHTKKVSPHMELVQVRSGASSGIDVDTDMQPASRDILFNYLENKYGEDRVFSVGTYSRLGIKSAIKDILRVYKVDYKLSNNFTDKLDSSLSLEDNVEMLKETYPVLYKFYLQHKEIIDMSKGLDGKIRQIGKHAGGVVILDRPIYDLIPVERVSGTVLTAFPESGSADVLDSLGVIKLDLLAISVLDIIKNTIESIEEDLYLIEDDDGSTKIVPKSYIDQRN